MEMFEFIHSEMNELQLQEIVFVARLWNVSKDLDLSFLNHSFRSQIYEIDLLWFVQMFRDAMAVYPTIWICFSRRPNSAKKSLPKITEAVPSINNVRAMVETASEEVFETETVVFFDVGFWRV